jgi:hypothetical protein
MRTIHYFVITLMLALPRVARAEPTYPAEMQSHLGLNFTPLCTLCHANNAGGLGTVTTPFGKALMTRGLTTNIATLDPALDALASANIDSNGDGVPDIQQLKNGFDPNTGAHVSNLQQEQFGCGAQIAPRNARPVGHGLILIGIVLLVLHRCKISASIVRP